MSFNVRLGYGMARVYGFTDPLYVHGAYSNRRILLIPGPNYCRYILRRDIFERQQGRYVTGPADKPEGAPREDDRAGQ